MTKAEMEDHWRRYATFIKQAHDAEKVADFPRVISHAEASWDHIDGMLRHVSKQDGKTERQLEGFALVLRYAPVLFDYLALSRVEQFLAGKRRITKASSSDLADDLAEAFACMSRARVIWDELERHRHWSVNSLRERFSGSDDEWRHIIGTWTSMSAVIKVSVKGIAAITLVTRMDDAVVGKCPNCGKPGRQTKSELLAPTHCESCRRAGIFVHIADTEPVGH